MLVIIVISITYEFAVLFCMARHWRRCSICRRLSEDRLSTFPSNSTWTYDYNAEIVRKADELGFEIAFSPTQWLPKGGYGGYDGEASLDSLEIYFRWPIPDQASVISAPRLAADPG